MSKNNTKSKEEKKNVIKKAKSPLKKKGQRGKAKPIIEVKKISKETKKAIAKKLAEELPEEKEVEFAFKGPGRNTVMTKTIVSKLITYFVAGLSDEDACELAGISRSTLNRYIKKYPAFGHKKNSAKNKITNQARLNIANDIDSGGLDSSWKRVKAKDPEFKSRSLFGGDEGLEGIKINEINIKISKK